MPWCSHSPSKDAQASHPRYPAGRHAPGHMPLCSAIASQLLSHGKGFEANKNENI